MILEKCKLIIYCNPNGKNQYLIINENDKIIEDAVKNDDKISINFNDFPSNIFFNIKLYLGNEYQINDFKQIIAWLKFIFESDNDYNQYNFFKEYLFFDIKSEYGKQLLEYCLQNNILNITF